MANILVIDDEKSIRIVLCDILKDENFHVFDAADSTEAFNILKTEPIDLIFLDVWLPGLGGIEILEQVKTQYPLIQIIVISGHASINIAVKAIKMGAFDFIEKPIDMDKALTLCRNALTVSKLTKENIHLKTKAGLNTELIGSSDSLNYVKKQALQAARSDAPCLITGENGVGKELLAQLIHWSSNRTAYNFIEINCAAIPDNLIESELFGHEKGSFTGAIGRRIGQFEQANNGTIFLDEIGDLSLNAQAKVLRALQEQRFNRVGGNEEIHVNVRLIAATNKDLTKAIAEKTFRQDLFFRLNVIPLEIKPLRERRPDIEELLLFFIKKYDLTEDRIFSADALNYLKDYSWPGNVRQLKNFCERICVLSEQVVFSLEEVKLHLEHNFTTDSDLSVDFSMMKLNEAKDLFEKNLITQAIKQYGSISLAAEKLGLYASNLHAKLKKYGIEVKK